MSDILAHSCLNFFLSLFMKVPIYKSGLWCKKNKFKFSGLYLVRLSKYENFHILGFLNNETLFSDIHVITTVIIAFIVLNSNMLHFLQYLYPFLRCTQNELYYFLQCINSVISFSTLLRNKKWSNMVKLSSSIFFHGQQRSRPFQLFLI